MTQARLDKYISGAMNISRADAKKMITKGFVTVNGNVNRSADFKITNSDTVMCNGTQLNYIEYVYYIINKPAGVVCTTDAHEPSVIELLPDELKRKDLFCVGRLDKDTTGLLIITNDGDYCHKVISPKNKVIKKYITNLAEPVNNEGLKHLEDGVMLNDGIITEPAQIFDVNNAEKCITIGIYEGKYHQVKRMFAAIGNKVVKLHRQSIGALVLPQDLNVGECREMTVEERNLPFVDFL